MRYVRRPIEVDAIQVNRHNRADVEQFANAKVTDVRLPGPGRGLTDGALIHGLDWETRIPWGWWLIRYDDGTLSGTPPESFAVNFDPLDA